MSYCTPEKVKSMFRCLDDVTDPAVTDAEIQELIDENCAAINGCLGELYQLPITAVDNPESFLILQKLCKLKTAATLDDILNSYGEADKKPTFGKQAHELLEKICPPKKKGCKRCEPTMKLPDAQFLGANRSGDTIAVQATSGRIFQKGVDTW